MFEIEEDSSRGNLGKTTSSAKHLDDGIDEETEHDHGRIKEAILSSLAKNKGLILRGP